MNRTVYLYVFPEGGGQWLPIGWFFDQTIQSTRGPVYTSGFELAMNHVTGRTRTEKGWWYVFPQDPIVMRSFMGRYEQASFSNGEYTSPEGLSIVTPNGNLTKFSPYQAQYALREKSIPIENFSLDNSPISWDS